MTGAGYLQVTLGYSIVDYRDIGMHLQQYSTIYKTIKYNYTFQTRKLLGVVSQNRTLCE